MRNLKGLIIVKKKVSKKLLMLLSLTMVVSLFALGTANGEDGAGGADGAYGAVSRVKDSSSKGTCIMNIDQSPNLNDMQRAALKDEVKEAKSEADFEKITVKAEELSDAMTTLRKVVTVGEMAQDEVNFTKADTKYQEDYENQLSIGSSLVAKSGPAADKEFVRNTISKIQKSESKLNGEANKKSLAEGKQDVIDAANAMTIINDSQKKRITAKVQSAKNEAQCRRLKEEVVDLRLAMEDLKKEVAESSSVKAKDGYLAQDANVRKAYEEAIETSKAVLRKDGPGVNDKYVRELLAELRADRETLAD